MAWWGGSNIRFHEVVIEMFGLDCNHLNGTLGLDNLLSGWLTHMAISRRPQFIVQY